MSCSNCYNGCSEIVSDKCVKYTGVDVPVLGIKEGDSLSFVEQAIIEFLTSTLDGSGIKIDIPQQTYCTLVSQYLPTCGDISVVDVLTALIKAACDLQVQVSTLRGRVDVIEASYTIPACITGVTSTSGTHAILQAVLTKLCAVDAALAALAINISTTYVKLADLNSLIAAYLASVTPVITQQYQKMVPYTVVEYYPPGGSLSNFDITGKGLASAGFDKIYLCNGQNGTPDKRGRVGVGVIYGTGLNPNVDPIYPGNPSYTLGMLQGTNTITLSPAQIPSHTHANTATVVDPTHRHDLSLVLGDDGNGNYIDNSDNPNNQGTYVAKTQYASTGITVTMNNAATGGGQSHSNIQPVLACYYIMYIP